MCLETFQFLFRASVGMDFRRRFSYDVLLEILLIVCNVLIFNIYCVSEIEKETKWKQQNQETPK